MQILLSRSAICCCLNRGTIYCCFGNMDKGNHGPLLRWRVKSRSYCCSSKPGFQKWPVHPNRMSCAVINNNYIRTEPYGSFCPLLHLFNSGKRKRVVIHDTKVCPLLDLCIVNHNCLPLS